AEKPFGPPDLDKLQARCETLVKEIGGASVPLHRWENIIPSPTPSPSPSPSSTASGTPSPLPSPAFAFPVSTPAETASPGTSTTQTHSPAARRSPHSKPKP